MLYIVIVYTTIERAHTMKSTRQQPTEEQKATAKLKREESLELSRISGRLVEFEALLNLLETAIDSKNKKRQQNSSESDSENYVK